MKTAKSSTVGRHSGLLAVFTLVNGLLIVFFLFVRGSEQGGWGFLFPRGDDSAATDPGALGPVVKLPNVVVKLQTASADLYVDAAFDLEVGTEDDKAAVRQRLARLREATIGVLSGLTPADVRGSHEIEKTKGRLLRRFRTVVPEGELRALYVTNLIVD